MHDPRASGAARRRRRLQVIQQPQRQVMSNEAERRSGSISHLRLVMLALPPTIGPATPKAAACGFSPASPRNRSDDRFEVVILAAGELYCPYG